MTDKAMEISKALDVAACLADSNGAEPMSDLELIPYADIIRPLLPEPVEVAKSDKEFLNQLLDNMTEGEDYCLRHWPTSNHWQAMAELIAAYREANQPKVGKSDEWLAKRIAIEWDKRDDWTFPKYVTYLTEQIAAYRESWKCPKCGNKEK